MRAGRPVAPDRLEQLALGEDPRGIAGQHPQQAELLVGERHLALADPDLAPGRVDDDLAHPAAGLRARPQAAPQHGADPRPQLRIVERLDQVIVGAEVEPANAIVVGAATGEDDHRQARDRSAR